MRSIALASMLLLTLTLSAQDLPDAANITKQVQEAAKQRKSIEYVKEITGEVTLDGKPLEKGHLEFTPVDGQGQTGGIMIAEGKFSGPIPVAKMRVKIHAPRVINGAYQAIFSEELCA